MSEKKERVGLGEAFVFLIAALFTSEIGLLIVFVFVIGGGAAIMTSCNEYWSPRAWRGLPSVISTKDLAGKTIKDAAAKRCFTVVQQDGQPRFVPADCPKGK